MNNIVSLRPGDLARFNRLNDSYEKVSAQLEESKLQATTGFKGSTYKAVGEDTLSALNISIAKKGAVQFQENMALVDQRLGFAETAVTKTIGVIETFRSRLAGAVNPGTPDSSFQKFCQDALKEVAQALNVQDVGRNNIFGGNEWETPPVDLDALPVPIPGGAISTNYYRGTEDTLVAQINEGKSMDYGIRADASGFAKALHALKIGATMTPDYDEGSANMQLLREAMTIGGEATIELSDELAALGTNRKTLDVEKSAIEGFMDNANKLEQDYIGVDVTQAWIQFMAMKEQLLGIATAFQIENESSKQFLTILR